MDIFLGIAGSSLSTFIALPQAIRAYRVGVKGVSATTYQLFTLNILVWLIYDFREKYWIAGPGIISQLICGLVILWVIYRATRDFVGTWLLVTAVGMVVLSIGPFISNVIVGWIAVITGTVLALPQLRDVFISKDVSGISVPTWFVFAGSCASWFGFGLFHHDARLLLANGITFFTSMAIALETMRRRAENRIYM